MKRFTETEKWTDKWFRRLTPGQKLVFMYLCDNCDCAGFYEIDRGMMAFQIQISEDQIDTALAGLSKSFEISDCGEWIWLKNFLDHQRNLPLNPDNKAHKGIYQRILNQSKRFKQGGFKPLLGGYGIGIGKGNSKEKKKKRIDYCDDFATFWSAYPGERKTKKLTAYRKWQSKIESGYTNEEIINGIKTSPQTNNPEPDYIPAPEVWLNGNGWEDEPSPAARAEQDQGMQFKNG